MSGFAKQVDERMKKMEDDMKSVKEGMHELKTDREIKESVAGAGASQQVSDQSINSSGREPPSTNAKEILGSFQDRMDRKNNVVFYNVNVKEGLGNLVTEKVKHDKAEVKVIA
ncbi:hypothetical protein DPMN_008373 [Dreissena polymorpha]|uniref:Uncharacterized protein n=1 Tax=Dreissena polymorpha TaxID=45954 RepID=A0A9D4MY92_DREPO|nr:hypothetical protein DPMN_008373 [Dreissena polymorpha]